MKFRFITLAVALLLLPAMAFAVTCAAPTVVPADGRVVDFDFVPVSGTNYYQFDATAGKSYSVEVRQDYDDINTDLTVTVGDIGSPCPTLTTLANTTLTTASEPALPANATRVSFTAAATGTYKISVANGATLGHYISVSVAETTIYNARWSTFSSFVTQWGFKNTTSATVTVKMVVTDTLGSPTISPVTSTFTVPAGSEVFKITLPTDLNIPGQHGGFALVTHNGPPGAIQADAYFINPNGSVIVPALIGPVRDKH